MKLFKIRKNAVLLCMLVFLLGGCAVASLGSKPMSMHRFEQIPLGINSKELVSIAGKPYEITKGKKPGTVKYVYIERFSMPGQERQARRYIVEFSGGRVSNKYFLHEEQKTVEFLLEKNAD